MARGRRSDAHRHDHAEVAGVRPILGITHALGVLVLELQAHAIGLDRGEELRQVVRVHADAEFRPFVGAGDLLDRLAQVRVGGRDDELIGRELQAHGAGAIAGQERHPLHGLGQRPAVEEDLLVVVFGDHPLVVREGPLEDAADQLAAADPEGEVVLAAPVGELALPLEPLDLLQGLARHQDRGSPSAPPSSAPSTRARR